MALSAQCIASATKLQCTQRSVPQNHTCNGEHGISGRRPGRQTGSSVRVPHTDATQTNTKTMFESSVKMKRYFKRHSPCVCVMHHVFDMCLIERRWLRCSLVSFLHLCAVAHRRAAVAPTAAPTAEPPVASPTAPPVERPAAPPVAPSTERAIEAQHPTIREPTAEPTADRPPRRQRAGSCADCRTDR